jgi:hypothetical protein
VLLSERSKSRKRITEEEEEVVVVVVKVEEEAEVVEVEAVEAEAEAIEAMEVEVEVEVEAMEVEAVEAVEEEEVVVVTKVVAEAAEAAEEETDREAEAAEEAEAASSAPQSAATSSPSPEASPHCMHGAKPPSHTTHLSWCTQKQSPLCSAGRPSDLPLPPPPSTLAARFALSSDGQPPSSRNAASHCQHTPRASQCLLNLRSHRQQPSAPLVSTRVRNVDGGLGQPSDAIASRMSDSFSRERLASPLSIATTALNSGG